jgi:hypothetical protein
VFEFLPFLSLLLAEQEAIMEIFMKQRNAMIEVDLQKIVESLLNAINIPETK